jgi:hypothetical protein
MKIDLRWDIQHPITIVGWGQPSAEAGFEVLTAVSMKMAVFWIVAP